jgi:hypothetical protein
MNRQEFQQIRDLPEKKISVDIVWSAPRDSKPNIIFEQVPVENSLQWDIILNGTFKREIPSCTFNFVLRGTGPICRVEVNATIHEDVGRNHKHELRKDTDPRNNLPSAIRRDDLVGKSAREIFEVLCKEANIIHTGQFQNPESP